MSAVGAKKRFGQHFLHDPRIIARILTALDPRPGERIVEIGPGRGALTGPLLARIGSLDVVEIDRDVVAPLRAACDDAAGLRVHLADALEFDFRSLAPPGGRIRLVGNLPYNISTPLLFHLLEQADAVQDMLFMLQKEVVDRMAAGPDEDAYGRLSVALAARAEVVHLFDVGPGAFNPPPQVDSAIVRLVPRPPAFEILDAALFDRVVTAAFGQRRKQLGNSLKTIADGAIFEEAGIEPRERAERLSAADFARLANAVARRSKSNC
ncbi:MAG: dimethyladenosine transferase [Panacagrimonas sp.]|nr:16S rRNA (adenine(1518)-N(6)/adenine(1519)-N(6))-dimethyltransferase RsmA [Panacagrimonas sp.]MCC2656758.1 dimethyladenosine transferase [Panacagrimonas sp.]